MGKRILMVILPVFLLVVGAALVFAEVYSPASSGGPHSTPDGLEGQKMRRDSDAGVTPLVDAGPSSQKLDERFYQAINGAIDIPDSILETKSLVTDDLKNSPAYQKTREAALVELVKSMTAIEDKEVGLPDATKRKIADAALSAQEKTGVDAVLLLAVARMESDFRNIVNLNAECKFGVRTYGCYADCGMTQHHVRGPLKYVQRRCKQLADNPAESFLESATELASHIKWCNDHNTQSWHRPIRRCILNRYNMGPFYKTEESCDRYFPCDKYTMSSGDTVEDLARRKNTCKMHWKRCFQRSLYWKKVTCFEYGARKQQRSAHSCRWCYNLKHIASYYYPKPAQDSKQVAPVQKSDPAQDKQVAPVQKSDPAQSKLPSTPKPQL